MAKLSFFHFQSPSERELPEDFRNYPTFAPSAIFGGVMASQTWEHFLGHPVLVEFYCA